MTKHFVCPDGLVRPQAYTPAVSVGAGTTIYVSGQVSQDANGNLVGEGNLAAQTEQVYRNLQTALTAAGASFADVVKINTYVVEYKPEYRDVLNRIRSRYVAADHPPASTLIGVQALARPGFLVEVEAVAVVE